MSDLFAVFLDLHGFIVLQQNGQRIICKRGAENSAPHNEIFLSHLPREFEERHIIEYLLQFGNICKIRTMLSFSGDCRGFSYIDFEDGLSAVQACFALDRLRICNNVIRCTISDENCRVIFMVFNWRIVPVLDMVWEVLQEINDITDGNTGVDKITVHDNNYHGQVHCFIKFNDHGKAAYVRKHLRNINKTTLYNAYFDWKKRCPIYPYLPRELLEIRPDEQDIFKVPDVKLLDIEKCLDYCDLQVML